LFQRTFSNRALALLQGVHQWLISQDQSRPINAGQGSKRVHVGIGVYLVQRSNGIAQNGGSGKANAVVARPKRVR
jgi:hypothetical protein